MSGRSQCPPRVTGGRRPVSCHLSSTRYLFTQPGAVQPQWWEGEERRGVKAKIPYQPPLLSPLENLQVLLGHGGCRQHRSPVGH